MSLVFEILSVALMAFGLLLFAGGTLGLLRLPDVYTRLHMAGKLDTLGSLSLLLGLAFKVFQDMGMGGILVGLKLLLVIIFVFLANPTATHALVDSGMRAGIAPWLKSKEERS